MKSRLLPVLMMIMLFAGCKQKPVDYLVETKTDKDARLEWWREARFGMFIHWGLYAVPAGEWNGQTNHAEWIRESAQIPLDEYNKFIGQFNPVKFNADDWVKMAKDAGMKYMVITSKHHDGFGLFDSKQTDFDVMSTPFKRDILKELSKACEKQGNDLLLLSFDYGLAPPGLPAAKRLGKNKKYRWSQLRPLQILHEIAVKRITNPLWKAGCALVRWGMGKYLDYRVRQGPVQLCPEFATGYYYQ